MAGEVVAPAVHVLDFGWQAPNPIDYQRAALASTEPMQKAMSEAIANRNQFALSQFNNSAAMQRELAVANVNNQRARELAQWQHEAQLQREQIRYNRMVDVAKLRAQSEMDNLKEKGVLDDIKSKNTYLTSRLGGDPIARDEGESDAVYGKRLEKAISDKLQSNITADTNAAYNIQKQINGYNKFVTDPNVNQAARTEVDAALKDPNVRAQGTNFVNTNFSKWLESVAGDKASAVADEMQKAPNQVPQILQKYNLAQQYNSFVESANQQAAYTYLKATGSSASRQLITANENLKILGQQLKGLEMMPGDRGPVPKPWWGQVQSAMGDHFIKDAQEEQKNTPAHPVNPSGVQTNPLLPPKIAPQQTPVTPPSVNPADFDAQGKSLNTAPFASSPGYHMGFGNWDFYGQGPGDAPSQAIFGPRTPIAGWSDLDRAKAEAASPGFWNGMIHAPGYWGRQVGSLFDSRVNPNNAFTPDSPVSYAALPYIRRNPVVPPVVNPAAAPVVAPAMGVAPPPAATNVAQLPPLPVMQAPPAGAYMSPFTAAPVSAASSPQASGNPFGTVEQMLNWGAMSGQQ